MHVWTVLGSMLLLAWALSHYHPPLRMIAAVGTGIQLAVLLVLASLAGVDRDWGRLTATALLLITVQLLFWLEEQGTLGKIDGFGRIMLLVTIGLPIAVVYLKTTLGREP